MHIKGHLLREERSCTFGVQPIHHLHGAVYSYLGEDKIRTDRNVHLRGETRQCCAVDVGGGESVRPTSTLQTICLCRFCCICSALLCPNHRHTSAGSFVPITAERCTYKNHNCGNYVLLNPNDTFFILLTCYAGFSYLPQLQSLVVYCNMEAKAST